MGLGQSSADGGLDGTYRFTGVDGTSNYGAYTVRVSAPGYVPAIASDVEVGAQSGCPPCPPSVPSNFVTVRLMPLPPDAGPAADAG